MKEQITQYCLSLGFGLVKFAKAELLTQEAENYRKWIDAGFNGKMEYLNKNFDKKEDVKLILPDAKTVIVLALPYKTADTYPDDPKLGKISRYAWGTDYHVIMEKKLAEIDNYLKVNFASNQKVYADTGPVMDRQWAVKAGIGWQGSNGNIINKNIGSWFFIASIITSLEIEQDELYGNFCGACMICRSACPTSAIIAPKVIDSNKCLAYLTVELKHDNDIPDNLQKNAPDRIFGCDICQEVCPWNKRAKYTTDNPLFKPRYGETALRLDYIKSLSKEEFAARFKNSPVKRTKLEGLLRNIRCLDDMSKS